MNILPVSQANGKSAISILNFTKEYFLAEEKGT